MEEIANSRRDLIELERKLKSIGKTYNESMKKQLEELKLQQSAIEQNYENKRKKIHNDWYKWFSCSSIKEVHIKVKHIAEHVMGLDELPYSLEEMDHSINNTDLCNFISKCYRINRFEYYRVAFSCGSFQELYSKVEAAAKDIMSIDKLPFTLADMENPDVEDPDIDAFILQCEGTIIGYSTDSKAKELIKFLKLNHPKVSYRNPKLSVYKPEDKNLISHIFSEGIDLPGARYNLFGHLQYFSSFFIDVFFGNQTEVLEYLNSLTETDLQKALERREGYCQYSPIFATILGLRLVNLKVSYNYTSIQKKEIRTMYSGNNENLHVKILKKLLELGADPNAHDINGYTPLHYAVYHGLDSEMTKVLIMHGANPNKKNRRGELPLSLLTKLGNNKNRIESSMIELVIENNAEIKDKQFVRSYLRSTIETNNDKDFIIRYRELFPLEKNECEKCVGFTTKACSGCGLVFYCSSVCQKLDWKFHKSTCKKNKRQQT